MSSPDADLFGQSPPEDEAALDYAQSMESLAGPVDPRQMELLS